MDTEEFSLATMLHLWLLVIQSQRSKLYGAIFSIMFFYGTAIRGYSQKIRGYSLECPGLTTRRIQSSPSGCRMRIAILRPIDLIC